MYVASILGAARVGRIFAGYGYTRRLPARFRVQDLIVGLWALLCCQMTESATGNIERRLWS